MNRATEPVDPIKESLGQNLTRTGARGCVRRGPDGAGRGVRAAPPVKVGFGFNARGIAGFNRWSPTGGGAFTPPGSSTGRGFRCLGVAQAPPTGCRSRGRPLGYRRLSDTPFKCTASAAETLKSARTDSDTVVLSADFYRAGDGNDESFTANMIVAAHDIAPDITGVQNVWVQGVGCATAIAHFSS